MESIKPPIDKGFARLTAATAFVTFALIFVGAITRTSNSGMGCGTYWPLCNGQIVPEFGNASVLIEYGHRLFAALVGLFVAGVMIWALWKHRRQRRIMTLAVAGVVLYFLQAGLGAVTVWLSNQWVSVLLHLINSMLLVACYIILTVVILNPKSVESSKSASVNHLPLAELLLTTILALLVALIGAVVAGNAAAKACVGYPLCRGELWPATQGPLQMVNMLHRLAAGGLGVMLVLMLIQVRGSQTPKLLHNALWVAFGLYIAQAALGALVVLVDGPEILFALRSLHVAFAAATWSAMIIVSTFGWLQQQALSIHPTSEVSLAPSVTTSN